MNCQQMQDVSEVSLSPMTEQEFATWRCKENANLVFHGGRYWEEKFPGFYQPMHLLSRLSAEQATCPARFHWGFQTSLSDADAVAANGSIPVHLLSDVENYDLNSLNKKRRYDIRKNRDLFKIVELTDAKILEEQGYEVFISATARTGVKQISREKYLASLVNYLVPKRRLVLGAFIEEKLCGYITGYAVNGTAYGEVLYMLTDILKYNINRILLFEFVQACRRSGAIHEFMIGQHYIEKPDIVNFKEGMGFPVKYIPAKVHINSIVKTYMRWRYPYKYYRLTGDRLILPEI